MVKKRKKQKELYKLQDINYHDLNILNIACNFNFTEKTMFCYGNSYSKLSQLGFIDNKTTKPTLYGRSMLRHLQKLGLYGTD